MPAPVLFEELEDDLSRVRSGKSSRWRFVRGVHGKHVGFSVFLENTDKPPELPAFPGDAVGVELTRRLLKPGIIPDSPEGQALVEKIVEAAP